MLVTWQEFQSSDHKNVAMSNYEHAYNKWKYRKCWQRIWGYKKEPKRNHRCENTVTEGMKNNISIDGSVMEWRWQRKEFMNSETYQEVYLIWTIWKMRKYRLRNKNKKNLKDL